MSVADSMPFGFETDFRLSKLWCCCFLLASLGAHCQVNTGDSNTVTSYSSRSPPMNTATHGDASVESNNLLQDDIGALCRTLSDRVQSGASSSSVEFLMDHYRCRDRLHAARHLRFGSMAVPATRSIPISKHRAFQRVFPTSPASQLLLRASDSVLRKALQQVYTAAGGPTWLNHFGWLSENVPICSWNGIACDSSMNVISLKIVDNNISGTLATDIGSIASLQKFILSGSGLIGTLPSQIGNLAHLTELAIVSTSVSGTIPESIYGLSNLTLLSVYNNRLSGTLSTKLGQLKALQSLDMFQNAFTGSLPTQIGHLSALAKVYIGTNLLTGTLPTTIGNCTKLIALGIQQNKFSGTIPLELFRLSSVTVLNLFANELTGTLSTQIGLATSLRTFEVQANQLSGTVPTEIGSLPNFHRLFLQGNRFSSSIPSELAHAVNLGSLNIADNMFSGTLPSEFGVFTKLQHVDLHRNRLSGTIPSDVLHWNSSVFIDWSYNRFSGTLPTLFHKASQIMTLDISNNLFTGALPLGVGFAPLFSVLDASSNPWKTSLNTFLTPVYYRAGLDRCHPTTESQMVQCLILRSLRAASASLSGTIPEELMAMDGVTELVLRDNPALSGTLPPAAVVIHAQDSISNFPPPRWGAVDLSANPGLSGPLPESWSQIQMSSFNITGAGLRAADNLPPAYLSQSALQLYQTPIIEQNPGLRAVQCPTFVASSNGATVVMDPEYYGFTACRCQSGHAQQVPGRCWRCPDGAQCDSGHGSESGSETDSDGIDLDSKLPELVWKSRPGFWCTKNDHLTQDSEIVPPQCFSCPLSFCVGGAVTSRDVSESFGSPHSSNGNDGENKKQISDLQVDLQCANNRMGVLCGTCVNGTSAQLLSGACVDDTQCNSLQWVIPVALIITGCVTAWWVWSKRRLYQNLRQFALSANEVETSLDPESSDTAQRVTAQVSSEVIEPLPVGEGTAELKALSFFYQIVPLLLSQDVQRQMGFFEHFMLGVVNLGFADTAHGGDDDGWSCLFPGFDAVGKLATGYMLPSMLLFWITLAVVIHRLRQKTSFAAHGEVMFAIFGISYSKLLTTTFQLVTCRQINGVHHIFFAGHVECFTGWQYALISIFIPILFFYPVFLIVFIRRTSASVLKGEPLLATSWKTGALSNLSKPFGRRAQQWEAVLMGQRLLLAAIASFSQPGVARSYTMAVTLLGCLISQLLVMPFKSKHANRLQTGLLSALVLVSLWAVATAFKESAAGAAGRLTSQTSNGFSVFIAIVIVTPAILVLVYYGRRAYIKVWPWIRSKVLSRSTTPRDRDVGGISLQELPNTPETRSVPDDHE